MVISIAVVIVRPYYQGLQPKARKHKTIVFITGGLEGNSNSWGLLRRTPGEPNHPPTVSALWPLRSGGTFLNIFLCLSRKCSWWSGVWTHLTVHCTTLHSAALFLAAASPTDNSEEGGEWTEEHSENSDTTLSHRVGQRLARARTLHFLLLLSSPFNRLRHGLETSEWN